MGYQRHRFLPSATFILMTTVLLGGCHGGEVPTRPSNLQLGDTSAGRDGCTSPPYTISGLITAYGGNPLADAHVDVAPYPFGYPTSTQTGTDGRYTVCGPPASKVGLQIWNAGYATAFKYDLPARDQTIDVVLRPRFEAPVGGGSVTGVIVGDEFQGGDDYFGGLCTRTPCKIVDFSYETCPCDIRGAEITLRWDDASTRLALYLSKTDIYFPPATVPLATRICCSSPLVATYTFNADFDRFAIGFEQAAGAPPGPHQRQTFELTIRPLPRRSTCCVVFWSGQSSCSRQPSPVADVTERKDRHTRRPIRSPAAFPVSRRARARRPSIRSPA